MTGKLHKQEKYPLVVQQLESQIRDGDLRAGQRMPTFAQMEQSFGVTSQTVSRALMALESKGLIVRQRGRGVFVAEKKPVRKNVRSEVKKRHGVIGLCGGGFLTGGISPYWAQLLSGIHAQAQSADCQVLLLDEKSRVGWEKVDGVLVSGWATQEILPHIPAPMPLVSLMVPLPGRASVFADDFSGAMQATEHLISQGHKRIAYLHGRDPAGAAQRVLGFQTALQNAGLKAPKKRRQKLAGHLELGAQFTEAGYEAMKNWLRNGWSELNCTALLAHNDEVAIGAMTSLREAKIRVPQDVSIVGFDGLPIGEFLSPRLTTVEVPLREIGSRAVEKLLQQIEADEVLCEHEMFPATLCVRESVASLAAR